MRARHASALRTIGRNVGEGLMWMGFGWFGAHPPHPWSGYVTAPTEQPCLPPLSEEEFARWTTAARHL